MGCRPPRLLGRGRGGHPCRSWQAPWTTLSVEEGPGWGVSVRSGVSLAFSPATVQRRGGWGRAEDVSPECQARGQSGCKEKVRSHFQSQIHIASAESLCSCIWGHEGWGGESRWSRGREALCLSSRQGVEGTRALMQEDMRARGQCWPPALGSGEESEGARGALGCRAGSQVVQTQV